MTTTTPATFTVERDDTGAPITSNTPAWLRRRQTGIGASEAPAILQMSRFSSPRDVALAKLADTITDDQTEAMEFGHLMEPVAVELFRRRHSDPESRKHRYLGQIVDKPGGLLRSVEHPHLLASLDALIREDSGALVPGQIKNVTTYRRDAWADSEGGVPDEVRVQVIQEALVLGADHGWVLPIFGGNHMPEPIRVDVDRDFAEYYLDYSAEWWQNYPAAGNLPEPTLLDDLSTIWAGVPGESVDLTPAVLDVLAEHKALKARVKSDEDRIAELALIIKTAMGDATEGFDRTGDKPRLAVTWRPHKQPLAKFHRDELISDHPELADLLDAYTRRDGATPRPLLVK